jgi:hypothetical protein
MAGFLFNPATTGEGEEVLAGVNRDVNCLQDAGSYPKLKSVSRRHSYKKNP